MEAASAVYVTIIGDAPCIRGEGLVTPRISEGEGGIQLCSMSPESTDTASQVAAESIGWGCQSRISTIRGSRAEGVRPSLDCAPPAPPDRCSEVYYRPTVPKDNNNKE